MSLSDTPPAFHGTQSPRSDRAQLDEYDATVPTWGIGDVDADGRWIPRELPGLLILAPHPDDEVLGTAALVAAGLRAGTPVTILAASDGTGSHPSSLIAAEELAEIRTAESESALEVLRSLQPGPRRTGSVDRIRLQLPDGELSSHVPALYEALTSALGQMPPGTLIAAPLSADGHPDHEACGVAAEQVAQQQSSPLVQYPVWLWLHSSPEDSAAHHASAGNVNPQIPWSDARAVPIDAELAEVRARAVGLFRSQLTTDLGTPIDRKPGQPVLTQTMLTTVLRDSQILFPRPPLDFEGLHAQRADPWGVTTRWYEQRKYALTMAALPRARYERAFEPGCSIGGLTEMLAARCEAVLASDISESALSAARERVGAKNVTFVHASIEDWPEGQLDLVLISELAYYLNDSQWGTVLQHASQSLESGGHLVSVHWRHPNAEAFRSAEEIRADLRAVHGWDLHGSYEDVDMLIDVLGPRSRSVAQAEFLD